MDNLIENISTEMSDDKEKRDFKQLFEEDKKRRVLAFQAYLEKGAKEYGCNVIPVVTITPKGVISSIEIEAY